MPFDAPFRTPPRGLDPDWFDYNGHLNMAWYNVLFDQALDLLFERFGCGPDYRESRNLSFFAAEAHVCYVRELKPGSMVWATAQWIDHDAKRIHLFQELRHADGWLAATSESLHLHIDMTGPKVAPMPDDVMAQLVAMADSHATLPRPERAGRAIAIVRKP
ncbi:(3S)-malyl-CoA thioesterase [Hoeflea marina]|uniref:(3S)-malyl-CoA thioesterase n=1 Tax=Hoeflea marina TaxID=274592 RepID=A0A317PGJ8_9HYPH|nr:thioesterase family protein [Hoeflea marina]PWV99165.1 (3S)-malyl-CoA thioesterase [Hoeflea marina]